MTVLMNLGPTNKLLTTNMQRLPATMPLLTLNEYLHVLNSLPQVLRLLIHLF